MEWFVVTLHDGACGTASSIPRPLGLHRDYSMLFFISPFEYQYSLVKRRLLCSKRESFHALRHCYVTWCPKTTECVASQLNIFTTNLIINWQLKCYFWQQWLVKSSIHGASDWHGGCGDTHSPYLHTILLEDKCMKITPANLQKYHFHVPHNYDSDIDG